jgi:antitoxin component of MazEF toxin-antitoxin module
MNPTELKVARIGNSRGVRLPAKTLERYGIRDSVLMEERSDGILLRPNDRSDPKLSWEETARAMAAEAEDWGAWETVASDGLRDLPWQPKKQRVAERGTPYTTRRSRRKP